MVNLLGTQVYYISLPYVMLSAEDTQHPNIDVLEADLNDSSPRAASWPKTTGTFEEFEKWA